MECGHGAASDGNARCGLKKLRVLKMNDQGPSDALYGLGGGIFFVGDLMFEGLGNLIRRRIGSVGACDLFIRDQHDDAYASASCTELPETSWDTAIKLGSPPPSL